MVNLFRNCLKINSVAAKRAANNSPRSLRMMESYGFVKLKKSETKRGQMPLIPNVIYSGDFRVFFKLKL
jgi:hypothetical protein